MVDAVPSSLEKRISPITQLPMSEVVLAVDTSLTSRSNLYDAAAAGGGGWKRGELVYAERFLGILRVGDFLLGLLGEALLIIRGNGRH